MNEKSVFDRDLKGFSLRIIITIIISTVSICTTILSTYFVMSNKIEHNSEINADQEHKIEALQEDSKTRDLRINNLEIMQNVTDAKVNQLEGEKK